MGRNFLRGKSDSSSADGHAKAIHLWVVAFATNKYLVLILCLPLAAVKVWLNGKLVHKNLVLRGVMPDIDRVPVTFKKGRNQLVLKILNCGGSWGFACRLLEAKFVD